MKSWLFTFIFFLCIAHLAQALPHTVLGVEVQEISAEKAEAMGLFTAKGVYIRKVVDESVAQRAGVQVFDFLYAINEVPVEETSDVEALLAQIEQGESFSIQIIRNKTRISLQAIASESSEEAEDAYENRACALFIGMYAIDKRPDYSLSGVEVSILPNSVAAEMGLSSGDLIQNMNGHRVLDWEDIEIAIQNMDTQPSMQISYIRNGKTYRSAYKNMPEEGQNAHNLEEWEDVPLMEQGFMGIFSETLPAEKVRLLGYENAYGRMVTRVFPRSAAEKAGLQAFDYLIGINEETASRSTSFMHLLSQYRAGETVTMHYLRVGKLHKSSLTFGRKVTTPVPEEEDCDRPFLGVVQIGSDRLSSQGVSVTVIENSTAARMGLKNYDQLFEIQGFKILEWSDLTVLMHHVKVGQSINVRFLRGGKIMDANGTMISYHATYGCGEAAWEQVVPKFDHSVPPACAPVTSNLTTKGGATGLLEVLVSVVDASDVSLLNNLGVSGIMQGNINLSGLRFSKGMHNGYFPFEMHFGSTGQTQIRILNDNGRVIFDYDLGQFSGKMEDKVMLKSTEIYYLQVLQNGGVFTYRLKLVGT